MRVPGMVDITRRARGPLIGILVLFFVLASLSVLVEPVSAHPEDSPHLVTINLPAEISADHVPLGGAYDIYGLVYNEAGRDITNQAEIEWSVSPDIASWTYISLAGMRLFPQSLGVLTVNATAWVSGASVSTSLDLTFVTTVDSVTITRAPETGFVYPGDELTLQVDLLDWQGESLAYNATFTWDATSGTVRSTNEHTMAIWTAGDVGTSSVRAMYTFGSLNGSVSITVEVLSELTSVVIDDLPEKGYEEITFEFKVTALDGEGNDVTSISQVRPALWVNDSMLEFNWTWNASSGYLGITPLEGGNASIVVQVEYNGIIIDASEDLDIQGIPPEEPYWSDYDFETENIIMLGVLIAMTMILIIRMMEAGRSSSEGSEDNLSEDPDDDDAEEDF
jgi:hypothetical protein